MGGIVNLGNTCYLNTAFQCMLHCEPFQAFLLKKRGHSIFNHILKLFEATSSERGRANPIELLRCLHEKMNPTLVIPEQNDIMEFISLFFDIFSKEEAVDMRASMHSSLKTISYEDTTFDRQRRKMDLDWVKKVGKEYSPLYDIFFGQSISQILCKDCDKIWHNYELFQEISVAMNGATLEECLTKSFGDSMVGEWKCDKCHMGNGSIRTTLLWRLPRVLIICLKRFGYSPQCNGLVKNEGRVAIPDILDMGRFCVGTTEKKYVLRSVAFHRGSFSGGHYHALCKKPDGCWYNIDDDIVFKVGQPLPDISSGYVFFYESSTHSFAP